MYSLFRETEGKGDSADDKINIDITLPVIAPKINNPEDYVSL